MFQRILLIFENERICEQAVRYSRELALRMDSEVAFLMLVEMAFLDRAYLGSKRNAIRQLEARLGKTIGNLTAEFIQEGIAVSVALRIGDAAQELLKFLAERLPFQVVIWGSDEDLPHGGPLKKHHWLGKIADTLECPLLAVTAKTSTAKEKEK